MVAEVDQLIRGLPRSIELAKESFRSIQRFIAADGPKEILVQQELRDLNVLSCVRKVLPIGHQESKFMVRLPIDGSSADVFEELTVPPAKVRIFGKLPLADCANDSVEDAFVSALRFIFFIGRARGFDKRIDLRLDPLVRMYSQAGGFGPRTG